MGRDPGVTFQTMKVIIQETVMGLAATQSNASGETGGAG